MNLQNRALIFQLDALFVAPDAAELYILTDPLSIETR